MLFRYKPVIVFEGLAYIATWCMLLWANGVVWMQFMEFAYGIATSTEVAYFTYIYAKVRANRSILPFVNEPFKPSVEFPRTILGFGINVMRVF